MLALLNPLMFFPILVFLHPTLVTLKYTSYFEYSLRSLRYMWVGLLTGRINHKLEKRNLINEHTLNCEPVRLNFFPEYFGLLKNNHFKTPMQNLNNKQSLSLATWLPVIRELKKFRHGRHFIAVKSNECKM